GAAAGARRGAEQLHALAGPEDLGLDGELVHRDGAEDLDADTGETGAGLGIELLEDVTEERRGRRGVLEGRRPGADGGARGAEAVPFDALEEERGVGRVAHGRRGYTSTAARCARQQPAFVMHVLPVPTHGTLMPASSAPALRPAQHLGIG